MLIGILSDTHDRLESMTLAMARLRGAGAEWFIHCGDVGGQRIIDCLAGLNAAFVWGNTDMDRVALGRYAESLGVQCGLTLDLRLGGKRIAVLHGDDHATLDRLLHGGQYDYLFHGHTHVFEDRRVGSTRLINPGALQRARPRSVAILDTAVDELRRFTFDR